MSEALGGVLCRCFTHVRMLRAIRRYANTRKA
jgi:aerobic-type carbon monoxide dehydrogenase small subunit (CoxS/CutS family)